MVKVTLTWDYCQEAKERAGDDPLLQLKIRRSKEGDELAVIFAFWSHSVTQYLGRMYVGVKCCLRIRKLFTQFIQAVTLRHTCHTISKEGDELAVIFAFLVTFCHTIHHTIPWEDVCWCEMLLGSYLIQY